MKNKMLLLIFLLLLLPLNVFASTNKVTISCEKFLLKNNEETTCKIIAKNLNFITTSISGKVKFSNNLELIESNYDNAQWKILDDKFNVKDINLISENKNIGSNYTIATFKVKAKNKIDTMGQIKIDNLYLGDENYESHNISVEEKIIDLKYDKQNEEINKNPTTSDLNIIIPTICVIGIIIILGYAVFLLKNKKRN
jgi:hypothetical protein